MALHCKLILLFLVHSHTKSCLSNLYSGRNGVGQQVLTWVPTSTTETFSGDILPLLSQPTGAAAIDFPADSDYLGYIAFGSEAFSSKANVTFSVPNFALDVQTS